MVTAMTVFWRRTGSSAALSALTSTAIWNGEMRDGLHTRFRRDRAAVVGSVIDENTMIEFRGCRIAQSTETMSAFRSLFGGEAELRAPEDYQGYGVLPWAGRSIEDAVEILIEQGSVPASFRDRPAEEQRAYVE